jgi:HAMP domain-containing protein
MAWYRNLPIGTKLVILLSFLLLALFVMIAIFVYRDERSLVLGGIVEKARLLAREVEGDINRIGTVAEKDPDLAFTYFHLFTQFQKVATDKAGKKTYLVHTVSARHRNPLNRPDPYEADQLRRFAAESDRTESYALLDGEKEVLRFLLPLRVNQSCLKCHGRFADAPAGVRRLYPEGHPSYGYRPGEVIGAVSVTVPLTDLYKYLRSDVATALFYRLVTIPLVVALVGFLIRRQVVKPVRLLSGAITTVTATGKLDQRVPHEGEDEVGRMIVAFNDMLAELNRRAEADKENNRRCGCVIDAARAAVVTFRSDGSIIMANVHAQLLFGMLLTELTGKDFYTLVVGGEGVRNRIDFYLMEGKEAGPIGKVTDERVVGADGKTKEVRMAISACKTATVMVIALFWDKEDDTVPLA